MIADTKPRRSIKGLKAREAIVREATALFAVRGIEAVSLRDVAAACDIPLSSLVHHFPQKLQLQEAAVVRSVDTVSRAILARLDEAGTTGRKIAIYIDNLVSLVLGGSPEIALLDREVYSIGSSEMLQVGIRQLRVNPANVALSQIIVASGSPMLDRMSPKRLGDILFATVFGVVKLRTLHLFDSDAAELTKDAIVRDLRTMIMRFLGLAEEPELPAEAEQAEVSS